MLIYILVIFFLAVLTIRFFDLYKTYFRSNISSRIIFISLGIVILLGAGSYILFSGFSKKNVKTGYSLIKASEFWNPYLFYRNKEITKIPGIHIFGEWNSLKSVSFLVEETEAGLRILEKLDSKTYTNDSILKIVISENGIEFQKFLSFNSENNLIKISSSNEEVVKYDFYSKNKLDVISQYSNGKLQSKKGFRYSNDKIIISEYDSFSNLISETHIEKNLSDLVKSIKIREPFQMRGFFQSKPSNVYDFHITKNFSYRNNGIEIEQTKVASDTVIIRGFDTMGNEVTWKDIINKKIESENVELKYNYDPYDNWNSVLSYVNKQVFIVELRRIQYKNGRKKGSINPTDYDFFTHD